MRPPDYLPGDKFIIPHLKNRMDQGFSNIVITEGPTRWGKSLADITIGAVLDPQFSIEKNVFHATKQLLYAFQGEFHPYITFVLEEGGKAASAEEWYKDVNKIIGWLAQSSAFKNFTLLINMTTDSSFAKKPRDEVTMILEGHESLRRGEFFIKLPHRKHNKKLGVNEIYKRFPRIRDENGYWSTLKTYQFPRVERLPQSIRSIWNDYLKLKEDDFSKSVEGWIEQLDNAELEEENKRRKNKLLEMELEKKENKLLYGTKRNMSPNQLKNLKKRWDKKSNAD